MTRILTSLVSFVLVGFATAAAVVELFSSNFDEILALPQPKFIEFYADWCGHCKNLAPIWEELAQGFSHAKDKVVIAKVNADQEKDIGKKYKISGFPTLKWFDGDKVEDYNGGRDLESFSLFIADKTGRKFKSNKPPSKVQVLNDRTFNETIGGSKNVLCAFTAPWCGHCKELAPVWDKVANDYVNEPSVVIAKVDCESPDSKKIAEEQGITGFPTIKWFPAGKKEPEAYHGGRTEDTFVEFINKEATLYRSPGGGLTDAAGTIATIDALIKDAEGNLLSKLDDIASAANDAKGNYALYYSRVAKKIQKTPGYVEKELARLQKIIKKGGLAPEKLDDLTSRSNVLRKFQSTTDSKGEGQTKEEL